MLTTRALVIIRIIRIRVGFLNFFVNLVNKNSYLENDTVKWAMSLFDNINFWAFGRKVELFLIRIIQVVVKRGLSKLWLLFWLGQISLILLWLVRLQKRLKSSCIKWNVRFRLYGWWEEEIWNHVSTMYRCGSGHSTLEIYGQLKKFLFCFFLIHWYYMLPDNQYNTKMSFAEIFGVRATIPCLIVDSES